jgi:radical SAM-linked protein
MAYSSGFSPHPRISYANASPTGAATEAEYLEIGLAETCDPAAVRSALDAALPSGLDILEVVVARAGALADQLSGSSWQIEIAGVSEEVLGEAVDALLAEKSVVVERMTKSGLRAFDVRPAIISLTLDRGRFQLVTLHLEPLVRPDDVLAAMAQLVPAFAPSEVPNLTRLTQGRLDRETGEISDPFDPR